MRTSAALAARPASTSAPVGFARMSTALFALLSVASMTAVWSILSLISGGFGGYMALIVAVCIVFMLHSFGYAPGFMRALAALVLMSLSVIYQAYLFAAGTIAGEMGFTLGESVKMIGPDLAYALIRAHQTQAELVCYGLALLLAFLLGWRFGQGKP